jgi:eukaryotic-like serine/threonine-protein kinase
MTLGLGERVGQYRLCREIGNGAMSTVYEAEHVALGKRIALKRMHPHLAVNATAAARFLREGKAATQIRSPHVVEVFDVGVEGGVPYMILELLEGVDLAAFLRVRRKIPLGELADLMVPLACAVCAAHDAGVVHRDLKPSNVFLTRGEGRISPIILDFGISKLTGDDERDLTASEALLGTVHYMSPEQTRGASKASARSDQYALGVMLYECATGAKPFAGSTPYAVMHAIVSARLVPPSVLEPILPTEFDQVVSRAMHRDPDQRFPSARDLGVALLAWATKAIREYYGPKLAPSSTSDGRVRVRSARAPGASFSTPRSTKNAPRLPSRRDARARILLAAGVVAATSGLVAIGVSARGARQRHEVEASRIAEAPPPPVRSLPVAASSAPPTPVPDAVTSPAEARELTSVSPVTATTRRAPASGSLAGHPLRQDWSGPATIAVRPAGSPDSSASAPRAPPERGTNGAFIVE